ncbi:HlyC/CorC family transporter [Alloprevotella tannerae]|uniref:CNNM domain-containing protein n=1 Tax=Alloprevotella tannerae TaxID=76122 RepID=UPI001EDB2D52|nr:hemolysin family protein [Alloprevotella tannerae]MCG2650178.1 HlyC/CorC family transporter [Alloprevotella tannerae]
MGLLIFYLLLALVVSFLCSIMEATLLSTPFSFITMKEEEGSKAAKHLRKFKQDIDRPISAILTLNTVSNTAGAAGVGKQAALVLGEEWFGWVSAGLTLLILVFSEIIPKTLGANHWRRLVIPMTPVYRALVFLTFPFVLMAEFITRFISPGQNATSVSREEVSAMVTAGTEEGVFKQKEDRMIQNMLKLSKVTAREIMTPSSVVEIADESMTVTEFRQHERYQTFSRIPVYKDDKDDYITGYVLRQTILEKLSEDKFSMRLSELVRPILSFQETESVSTIWERLLEKKEHISVIIDEYGCLRGIVTMEDVIETMLGTEIVDEKDTVTDMQAYAREQWIENQHRQVADKQRKHSK